MTGTVSVLRPGLHTAVQDTGRWGWQAQGVPVAGAMDLVSHRLANALVGNETSRATLEVTLQGPVLEFQDERRVAVCGADLEVRIDEAVQWKQPLRVRRGTRLHLGAPSRGARAYVAISGGVEVPRVLGSRATHVATGMGGFGGRALRAGDTLTLGPVTRLPDPPATSADAWRDLIRLPDRAPVSVRVLRGPDLERFGPDALAILGSAPFVVTPESDRQGYRLSGPRITVDVSRALLSEGTVAGAIQVPADRQPILLMADRQTTGGYPKLAVVIAADLPLVGQLAPGDSMAFVVCGREEAAAALVAQERRLMTFESLGAA